MNWKDIKGWWVWEAIGPTLIFALVLLPFVMCCPELIAYYVMLIIIFFIIFLMTGII